MPTLICSLNECDKTFYRRPCRVKASKTGKFYCCQEHHYNDDNCEKITFICNNKRCFKEKTIYKTKYKESKNHYCSPECFQDEIGKNIITSCSICGINLHKNDLADSGNFRNGKMKKRSWCKECERKRNKKIQTKLRKEAHPCYIASQHAYNLGLSAKDLPKDHILAQRARVLLRRQIGKIKLNQ